MGLSVRIDSLNSSYSKLESQKFSSRVKQNAESFLSKFCLQQQVAPSRAPIPFRLRVGSTESTLFLQGREIKVKNDRKLNPLIRLIRYHQHAGQLSRSGLRSEAEALRKEKTREAVLAVNKAAIPGTNGRILAGMRIAEDTLSLTRNILFAIPTIGSNDPIVTHLGYYAAIFWSFFSAREIDGGIAELNRSRLIGDGEGVRRAKTRLVSGGICSAASFLYLGGRICDTLSAASVSSGLLSTANVLFGAGSLWAMGSSALGVLRCYNFNERLNDYLENDNLTGVERVKGALQFLKDAVSVTPEEKRKLEAEIGEEYPHLDVEQKERLLEKKITDLTETKVKHLKRRTSNKSLQLILNKVDPLLAKLSDPKTESEGIKEATIMLNKIQRENKTKLALYALGCVAALISFIAMITMTFFSGGAFPFVLYGIAGTLYLSMTLFNTGEVLIKKGEGEIKEVDLHPGQDLALPY